jgi:hypothetical protein
VSLERLLVATAAVRREAFRRDAGYDPDGRFDVPIAMLLDLDDELNPPDPAEADREVERLHGEPEVLLGVAYSEGEGAGFMSLREFVDEGAHVDADGVTRRGLPDDDERALLDDCTDDAACESSLHLSTCPRRR